MSNVAAAQLEVSSIRILLILRRTLVRQAMVSLLDDHPSMRVVAHTATPEDGIRLVRDFEPDVAIVDIDDWNGSTGGILTDLKVASTRTRILVLSDEVHEGQVDMALRTGVEGYTLTSISVLELEHAITELARGQAVLHPEAASAVALLSIGRRMSESGVHALTPRQCEVLSLMAEGLPNKQIARKLGIGPQTVKTHVSRIFDSLGTASRTEAVALAMREGLVA